MAKKVTKTTATSADQVSSGAAPAKEASTSGPKDLKSQAVAVAAAVEGFVQSLGATITHDVEKAAEAEPVEEAASIQARPAPAPVEGLVPDIIGEAKEPELVEASPTTAEVSQAEVSALAYRFYLERGGQNGSPADDWFRAEQALHSGAR